MAANGQLGKMNEMTFTPEKATENPSRVIKKLPHGKFEVEV